MIWLPVLSGGAALGLLSIGLAPWGWPAAVIAIIALAVSVFGRWPAAGTVFCSCLVVLALAQQDDAVWVYAVVGLLLGSYLVLLDARESLVRLGALSGLGSRLSLQVAATFVGQAVVMLALVVPARGGFVVVVGSGGAAAMLFWWLAAAGTDTLKGNVRPSTRKRSGL